MLSEWNPEASFEIPCGPSPVMVDLPEGAFALYEDFLSPGACHELISLFEKREMHPVDRSGNKAEPGAPVGSWRANAWSTDLAAKISLAIAPVVPNFDLSPFPVHGKCLRFCESTPYLRFMKYIEGGMHLPHYDAPYVEENKNYMTLMSWVLYLNTPDLQGGQFQFLSDGQEGTPPALRRREDGVRMATSAEITASVAPVKGRLLVFPHWLPHQVAEVQSDRYLIRGDLAYVWE